MSRSSSRVDLHVPREAFAPMPLSALLTPLHARTRLIRLFAALGLAVALTACTTLEPEQAETRAKFLPRWFTDEVAFDEAEPWEKVGRNFRDGFTGVIDNLVQTVFSIMQVGPTSGLFPQKMATILGDGIGLIDDNTYSEHVFKAVISKQLLKYGSSAQNFEPTLGAINGIPMEKSHTDILDYVGNKAFHTDVYGAPSALVSLVAIITADLFVRPAGNFVLMFGFRDQARKIDEFGLKIIENSVKIPFL